MKEIPIVVFGPCCTREALLSQFVGGHLLDVRSYGGSCHSYIDGCRKECVIDGTPYMLEFEDGSLDLQYPSLVEIRERTNPWRGFLLLYDADSRESLKITEGQLEKLTGLVGSKDLRALDRLLGGDKNSTSSLAFMATANQDSHGNMSRVCAREDQNRRFSLRYFRSQRQQHQQTVDTFTCFPRLPAELQLAILRACVISSQPIFDHRPGASGINMNVLQVCRFFHAEGTNIYWAENRFESTRPIYLVADGTWPVAGRQQIEAAEGRALADRFGCKFFEHSSQSHDLVETLVMGMVRECIERSKDHPIAPEKSVVDERQRRSVHAMTRSLTQRVCRVLK